MLKRDLAFDPAAADTARRANALPAPTEYPHSIEHSPTGRGPLDPTFEENPLAGLSPAKAVEAGRKIRAEREFAVANPLQNAALLARTWGTSIQLAQRLLDVETENFLLRADIATLYRRLSELESKASQRHVADDLKSK